MRIIRDPLLPYYLAFLLSAQAAAWQSSSSPFAGARLPVPRRDDYRCGVTWTMRDASASYWFQVGDPVRVVDSVYKANINLKDSHGRVVETWEKCDVDPTCCCAEQVDVGMAVRVKFQRGDNLRNLPLREIFDSDGSDSFMHYFAEDELLKISPEDVDALKSDKKRDLPFDGMSCTAFKLDQLQTHQKARGIASFKPSRVDESAKES